MQKTSNMNPTVQIWIQIQQKIYDIIYLFIKAWLQKYVQPPHQYKYNSYAHIGL